MEELRDEIDDAIGYVDGVGDAAVDSLLTELGTIEAIKEASADEIASVQGMPDKVADRIKQAVGQSSRIGVSHSSNSENETDD